MSQVCETPSVAYAKWRCIQRQLDCDFRKIYRKTKRAGWWIAFGRRQYSLQQLSIGSWRVRISTWQENSDLDITLFRGRWLKGGGKDAKGAYAVISVLTGKSYRMLCAVRHEDWADLPYVLAWFHRRAKAMEDIPDDKIIPIFKLDRASDRATNAIYPFVSLGFLE